MLWKNAHQWPSTSSPSGFNHCISSFRRGAAKVTVQGEPHSNVSWPAPLILIGSGSSAVQGLALLTAPGPGLDVKDGDGWLEAGNADGHGLALCPWLRGNETHKTSEQTASWHAARLQKEVCKGRTSAQPGSVSSMADIQALFSISFAQERLCLDLRQACVSVFSAAINWITSAVIYLWAGPPGGVGGALDQVQIWSPPWTFDLPLGVYWRCCWSIHPGGIYVYAGWGGTDDICSNL